MALPLTKLAAAACLLATSSITLATELIDPRAFPNNPSGNYAPAIVDCPSARPTIRAASSLSPNETAWLTKRRPATVKPMTDLLDRANITGFDAVSYINGISGNTSALPNIAIAVSGGGYRALMNGGGFIAAADDRTPGSTDAGGIGGLLQSTTYLAGLSGGGWLVGSIYSNNFSSITALRDGSSGSSVWKFENSIFQGPKESGFSILNFASYWDDVSSAVSSKEDAGFDTSITDYWGRTLSYQLINATDGGPAYTFSSFAEAENLIDGSTPMPILVSDGRAPNTKIISLNSTVYEFNPFEMGSFDPSVFGFVPTAYIGSNFSNGVVPTDGQCVRGFDQAGFVMGTSSSLFNQFLLANISSVTNLPSIITEGITSILTDIGDDNNDIAQYMPNPFFGYNNATNANANTIELSLVDGGEDLQNLPLHPLTQPMRAVDVIFAVDSSADTEYNWPNGTALRATYERSMGDIANGTLFPAVPDDHTFVNLGLNNHPTFFGCDASNFTLADGAVVPPLVVYIPNAPYTAETNFSTFMPSYSDAQRNDIIANGLNAGSQGNATSKLNAEWPACVGCAILSRSLTRTGTDVPDICTTCFKRYCWNGTVDTTDRGSYEPAFKIGDNATAEKSAANRSVGRVGGPGVATWKIAAAVIAVFGTVILV